MTKNAQQSAYALPESAKTKMRGLIGRNEGTVYHPYLDKKGIITIGVGFNVDGKDEFLKLNLRKKGENDKEGPLMTEAEKTAAYDAMVKKRVEEKGNYQRAKEYKDTAKAYLSNADVNTRLDKEIADRVPKIREKIGAEAWDKLTDGQKATIAAVHFNVGGLEGSPKLVEAAKKGDAAGIARESHVVANKVTNGKGEVTKHERNWEAVMRNHCGALGLEAGSDACWRSVAAEYKDKPEEQRKLETFHPSMQKILDESPKQQEAKPEEAKPQDPQPTEPPQEAQQPEKQAELGADGRAFLDKLAQPAARPALEVAVKEPAHWTENEARSVIDDYQRHHQPEAMNLWLRERASDYYQHRFGQSEWRRDPDGKMAEVKPGVQVIDEAQPAILQDGRPLQKILEQMGGSLASAFDADGMNSATKSMQQGLNILNGGRMPRLKEDGDWGPITDFSFKKSVASHGIAKIDEGFALGRLQTLAEKPQVPEDLAKQTQGILGPLYGSQEKGDDHALALQAGLNEIGPKHVDDWQPLKLDGEIGPKTTDAFNQVSNAAGPMSFAQDMGSWLGWL